MNHKQYTKHLQWHRAIPDFDYDQVIDWAMDLLSKGIESEHILILASFSKPVMKSDIQPYVYGALQELGLEEKYANYSVKANVQYHLEQILQGNNVRKNLSAIYNLFSFDEDELNLYSFYLLYHAWDQLEEINENYYIEDATLDNIESILKEESQIWLDTHIHGLGDYKSKVLVAQADHSSHNTISDNSKHNAILGNSKHSLWKSFVNFIWKN